MVGAEDGCFSDAICLKPLLILNRNTKKVKDVVGQSFRSRAASPDDGMFRKYSKLHSLWQWPCKKANFIAQMCKMKSEA